MPRSTKGRAAARGLDARLILQHASCLLEMLHSKQLRSIKMLLDSNHGIYRVRHNYASNAFGCSWPFSSVSAAHHFGSDRRH